MSFASARRAATVLAVGAALYGGCSSSDAGSPSLAPQAEAGSSSDAEVPDSNAAMLEWDAEAGGSSDATLSDAAEPDSGPQRLSSTGLFQSIDPGGKLVLGDGVMPFEPKYQLWADGAAKSRWVWLPKGSKIDNSDPDHWQLPVGTKLWKEFAVDGQRIETRLIERVGSAPDDFRYSTYWWQMPDLATLVSAEDTIRNANGTTHDIPYGQNCHRCHDGLKEHVLGFSALQLSHDMPGVTLKVLTNQSLLTNPLPGTVQFPGADAVTRDALGYLHANCGNCHNDSPGIPIDALPAPQMYLRLRVADTNVADTGAYKTALNVAVSRPAQLGVPLRITGGDFAKSAIWYRMSVRATENQMPPLATKEPDRMGLDAMAAWISGLPAPK